ncbi:Major facilitator superfamily domain-containing 13B [Apodemus speciosus]|uniref:Major facilitator superfamily domain-containing 13B n=1 Tax=Apodemus speciosus TaxID=105296 RepID=A0ABQ0F021_APOSI
MKQPSIAAAAITVGLEAGHNYRRLKRCFVVVTTTLWNFGFFGRTEMLEECFRMKTSSAWKMTLLSIKSEAWAYSLITLGTEMLSSFFSFYYVKLFLDVYKISELAFYQSQWVSLYSPGCPGTHSVDQTGLELGNPPASASQVLGLKVILMIWNILTDLSGYFRMSSQYDCCLRYHCSLLGALLHAVAFLLPWFPWQHYRDSDWLTGLQLVVSLCAFDSTHAWVQQAQCRLFAETSPRHGSRLQLTRINQVASLVGSTSILFCGLVSHNMEILPNFRAVSVVIALLASISLCSGMFHMRRFEFKRNLEENFLSESEQELAGTSVILLMRQLLPQRNFYLFLIVNFFQVFHLTSFSNFMMIFVDILIPTEILSPSVRSIMFGAVFICPQWVSLCSPGCPGTHSVDQAGLELRNLPASDSQSAGIKGVHHHLLVQLHRSKRWKGCLVLLGQSWLKKYGYYKVILISFYLEGAATLAVLLLGQEHYYCLAVYLTVIMVIAQASFCLFNLPVADMVDADLLKCNWQSSLSLMVSVITALFARPAQCLAPMLILSKLSQHGYGELNNRILSDLQDSMFSLVCVVSLGIATMQILTWSSFSTRNRRDCSGTV